MLGVESNRKLSLWSRCRSTAADVYDLGQKARASNVVRNRTLPGLDYDKPRFFVTVVIVLLLCMRWMAARNFEMYALEAMSAYDADRDRALTPQEAVRFLHNQGVWINSTQYDVWVYPMDEDHDGVLDVTEVQKMATCFDSLPTATDGLRTMGRRSRMLFYTDTFCSVAVACGVIYLLWHARDQDWLIARAEDAARRRFGMALRAMSGREVEIQRRERKLERTRSLLQNQTAKLNQLAEQERNMKLARDELQREVTQQQAELEGLRRERSVIDLGPQLRRIFFLYASPVAVKLRNTLPHVVPALQFTDEQTRLQKALERGHEQKQLQLPNGGERHEGPRVKVGLATADGSSLIEVLKQVRSGTGCDALHLCLHGGLRGEQSLLLLEDAVGCGEWIGIERFREVLRSSGGCGGLELCVLSCCHGEEFGRELLRHGCRHVVCLKADQKVRDKSSIAFTEVFYTGLGQGATATEAFEKAIARLRAHHEDAYSEDADKYLLLQAEDPVPETPLRSVSTPSLKKRGAVTMALEEDDSQVSKILQQERVCATRSEPCLDHRLRPSRPRRASSGEDDLLGVASSISEGPCTGLEDFVGRATELMDLLQIYKNGRRCACVCGPAGIGKSCLLMQTVRFSGLPGRMFAGAAVYVPLSGKGKADGDTAFILRAAEAIRASLAEPQGAAEDTGLPKSTFAALEEAEEALHEAVAQLEKRGASNKGFALLALDDLAESPSRVQLLAGLLKRHQRLRVVLASKSPWKADLSDWKVVPFGLPGLLPLVSADLFLRRAKRPLYVRDFQDPDAEGLAPSQAGPSVPLRHTSELREKLCGHPVLQRAAGNPQEIRRLAGLVTEELQCLYHLVGLVHTVKSVRSDIADCGLIPADRRPHR